MDSEINKLEIVEPSALDTISRAEFDVQITTAKKYPRQLASVKAGMLSFATLDEETAASCFYTLPRGDKSIQGPSVRLAEIAVSCYGNLRAGSRVIATVTTGDTPHVIVQSVCHDLERNVAISIEKRRRIVGKKKNQGKIDEDDINLACNACAAIAFRDAVFKVIPGALIKPVFEQAKQVAIGDATTLSTKRLNAIDRFGKMGVSKERILGLLSKKTVDEVDVADLETLIGLYTAIKDGQTTIDDAFPAKAAASPEFKKEAKEAKEAGKAAVLPPTDEPPITGPTPLEKTAPTNEQETPKQFVVRMLTDAEVIFDDFRSYLSVSGISKDADSYGSFDEIPADVFAKSAEAKTLAKIIKTFGKKKN